MQNLPVDNLVADFLVPYNGNTRSSYATDLRLWFQWLAERDLDPFTVRRVHIETYSRESLDAGKAKSTVYRKLVVICGWYRYLEEEDILTKSPGRYVRRPRVPPESQSAYLDRGELGRFVHAADRLGPKAHTVACLLALNGLRASEAAGALIDNLAFGDGHHTLSIVGKNDKPAVIPLAPRTSRTITRCVGERRHGPILLNSFDQPMQRHSVTKIVKRIATADIDKHVSPHVLRHSFITAALDAGVGWGYVKHAARHSDMRSTARYDHTGDNLDHHAAYIVASWIAGGA